MVVLQALNQRNTAMPKYHPSRQDTGVKRNVPLAQLTSLVMGCGVRSQDLNMP